MPNFPRPGTDFSRRDFSGCNRLFRPAPRRFSNDGQKNWPAIGYRASWHENLSTLQWHLSSNPWAEMQAGRDPASTGTVGRTIYRKYGRVGRTREALTQGQAP